MSPLYLPFLTAAAVNSFLNLGFGVRTLARADGSPKSRPFAPAAAIGLAGLFVWPVFNIVLAPLALGYLEAILLVPLSVLLSTASDRLVRAGSPADGDRNANAAASAYDGLTYAASFLILRLSAGFLDAFLLALGAVAGYLICEFSLRAIRDRSDVEPVPRCLRGVPLMLIAAALMAVVSSFLAAAAFRALGGPV
jgi:Na+-translocating ferredoxin:NAD+ oxidoreductase RnfA subunit